MRLTEMTPFSCGIVLNSGSSFTCRDACADMRVLSCVCRDPRTYLKYLRTPVCTCRSSQHPRRYGRYLWTPCTSSTSKAPDVPKEPPAPRTLSRYLPTPQDMTKYLPTMQDVRRQQRWRRTAGMRAGGGGTHPILR